MSLKVRLVATLTAVLLVGLVVAAGLVVREGRARASAATGAAMTVAWATTGRALQALPEVRRSPARIEEIVHLFDGDRHVRAAFLTADGRVRAASLAPRREGRAPDWFVGLLAGTPRVARFDLGPLGAVELRTDATAEADASLAALIAAGIALLAVYALSLALGLAALARLGKPLDDLSDGFARIGSGDYRTRVVESGPAELARLGEGFNRMAERLADMRERNARLAAQLAAVQDEERAELARDLHDEVGPLLFAVDVDATSIEELLDRPAAPGRDAAIRARTRSVREAAAHMKRKVRALLGQLRPGVVAQLGLRQTVQDLAAFWRDRHPQVTISCDVPEETFGADVDAALHMVVREAVSNALKHGRPRLVEIEVRREAERIRVRVADDGGGLRAGSGFGIVGMRERIAALGGRLTVDQRVDVPGVAVTASMPLAVTGENRGEAR